MWNKDKKKREETDEQIRRSMPRSLPMPSYDYQTPTSGTFVVRYDEQNERQERAAQEKAPSLQNLKLNPI